MVYADLHIHSCYSDGEKTPEEILKMAFNKGIKCISVTDHDSIASQIEILNSNYTKVIDVIPGIEISSRYYDKEIHILGYFIDIKNNKLINTLNDLKVKRVERAIKILEKLNTNGICLDVDELDIDNCTIGRGNIAQLMVKKGYVNNKGEAFANYLSKGKCAYVQGEKLSTKDAIKLVIESEGMPTLAHPGKIYGDLEMEKMLREFKVYGLKGIEVYHPGHSREKMNYFHSISKKYKLLITGGSDFHVDDKESGITVGCEGIKKELLERLRKYEIC